MLGITGWFCILCQLYNFKISKKSMLTKFNLTCFKLKNMSISYPDFYNQANYKLGDDFYISLGNLDQKKAIIDSVDFENDIVDVE